MSMSGLFRMNAMTTHRGTPKEKRADTESFRNKVIRTARKMYPGREILTWVYDGFTRPLIGWALIGSPLALHIQGIRPRPAFTCYTNPRDLRVHKL